MTGWQIVKKSYKEFYKNLSAVFIASIFWFLTAGIVILANLIALNAIMVGKPVWILPFLVLAVITVGPATAGAFYITNRIVKYGNISFTDFFVGAKKYFVKSIALTFLLGLIAIILVFDFHFFTVSDSIVLQFLSGIWLYGIIFLSIVAMYSFTILIELDQLEKEECSIKNIIKYSALLSIKEIKFTLFVYINLILYSLLGVGLVITLPTLFIGGLSLLANNATLNLLVRHNIIKEVSGPHNFS